jgi:hypothetical protein
MLKIPPDQANQIAKEIKSTNPELYKKLVDVKKERKLGVTVEDKTLKDKGVGSGDRVLEIAKQIKKLKTPEEKNAYVQRLIKVGVITDKVKQQLIEMKKRGEL